jgi:hypothetical protein
MTVADLIAALKLQPADARVVIVYDSAVCNENISAVLPWRPGASFYDDSSDAEIAVGLFDKGSADDFTNDPDDPRRVNSP